jgi:hypothetical protein
MEIGQCLLHLGLWKKYLDHSGQSISRLPHSTLVHHPLLPVDPAALVDATATSNVHQIQILTIMYFPKQQLHVIFS